MMCKDLEIMSFRKDKAPFVGEYKNEYFTNGYKTDYKR